MKLKEALMTDDNVKEVAEILKRLSNGCFHMICLRKESDSVLRRDTLGGLTLEDIGKRLPELVTEAGVYVLSNYPPTEAAEVITNLPSSGKDERSEGFSKDFIINVILTRIEKRLLEEVIKKILPEKIIEMTEKGYPLTVATLLQHMEEKDASDILQQLQSKNIDEIARYMNAPLLARILQRLDAGKAKRIFDILSSDNAGYVLYEMEVSFIQEMFRQKTK